MRFIMLDTETTGLSAANGDRVIELGCVEVIDRTLTGNDLHLYFNPERGIDAEAIAVHGITEEFLADKPVFNNDAQQILDYLSGATLVIHNSAFDLGFLDMEFAKTGLMQHKFSQQFASIDTLAMARKMFPGARCSLDALCKRYSIDLSGRSLHGALLDAQLLAKVYLGLTGGQVQMFAESTAENQNESNYEWLEKVDDMPLVQVSAEELQAHQQYLQELRGAGKAVLWPED